MILFKANGKEYQLRMTTKACISCEKRLGKNPLNVFMEATDNRVPKISELMVILHEAMSVYNHSIKLEDVYDIYDQFCADGGDIMSLIEILIEVFQEAGFIPKEEESKN